MADYSKLPIELLHAIGLCIEDAKTFKKFCCSERRLWISYQSIHYRTEWLKTRHPNHVSLFSNESSTYSCGLSMQECQIQPAAVIEDATVLNVYLSLSLWNVYFANWLRQCSSKQLPIFTSDGILRDGLVVHVWHHAFPAWLRHQLLPSPNRNIVFKTDLNNDIVVGPDFQNLGLWLREAFNTDVTYFDFLDENKEASTSNILPEGLFEASNSWIMPYFRSGWITRFMETTFGDIETRWNLWIKLNLDAKHKFDSPGLECFQNSIRQRIDPWFQATGKSVWRM
jgi:hypothetical protein